MWQRLLMQCNGTKKLIISISDPVAVEWEAFQGNADILFERVIVDRLPIAVATQAGHGIVLLDATLAHWLYRVEFVASDFGIDEADYEELLSKHPVANLSEQFGQVFGYDSEIAYECLLTTATGDRLACGEAEPHKTYLHAVNGGPCQALGDHMLYAVDRRYWKQLLNYLLDRVEIVSRKGEPKSPEQRKTLEVRLPQIPSKRSEIILSLRQGVRVTLLNRRKKPRFIIEPAHLFQAPEDVDTISLSQLQQRAKPIAVRLMTEISCLAVSTRGSSKIGYVRTA